MPPCCSPRGGIPDAVGDFAIKSLIGTGSFASIWLAEHTLTGHRVAIKALPTPVFEDESVHGRFVHEIALMKQIDHPLICHLYEVIETPSYLYLVLEYLESGTLLSRISQGERLPERAACRLFCQLIACLDYLHNRRLIMHRDIKPENVLLDEHGNLRLIDFGLSCRVGPQMRTFCGSAPYVPPEMVQRKPYTAAGDVWSAGVLLYGMVAGKVPFDVSGNGLWRIVFSDVEYPAHFSSELVDLLRRILMKAPGDRATIEEIKEHAWVARSGYGKVVRADFETDDLRVSAPDEEIIRKLDFMGGDGTQAAEARAAGLFGGTAAAYAILRRPQIKNRLKKMRDELTCQEQGEGSDQTRPEILGLPVTAMTTMRPGMPVVGRTRRASVLQTQQRPILCKPRPVLGASTAFLIP
jgi:5'-AMP-activated protein kinase catalytic alpha subunit